MSTALMPRPSSRTEGNDTPNSSRRSLTNSRFFLDELLGESDEIEGLGDLREGVSVDADLLSRAGFIALRSHGAKWVEVPGERYLLVPANTLSFHGLGLAHHWSRYSLGSATNTHVYQGSTISHAMSHAVLGQIHLIGSGHLNPFLGYEVHDSVIYGGSPPAAESLEEMGHQEETLRQEEAVQFSDEVHTAFYRSAAAFAVSFVATILGMVFGQIAFGVTGGLALVVASLLGMKWLELAEREHTSQT